MCAIVTCSHLSAVAWPPNFEAWNMPMYTWPDDELQAFQEACLCPYTYIFFDKACQVTRGFLKGNKLDNHGPRWYDTGETAWREDLFHMLSHSPHDLHCRCVLGVTDKLCVSLQLAYLCNECSRAASGSGKLICIAAPTCIVHAGDRA